MRIPEPSQLKNEASAITSYDNRLPGIIEYMYPSSEGLFDLRRAKYEGEEFFYHMRGEDVVEKVPEKLESVRVALDQLQRRVITWLKAGKGTIRFYNDLVQKDQELEFECTSISCSINKRLKTEEGLPELVVAYTVFKDGKTQIWLRYQTDRYATPELYGEVKGDKVFRTIGLTPTNRFLFRFFERVEVVENA